MPLIHETNTFFHLWTCLKYSCASTDHSRRISVYFQPIWTRKSAFTFRFKRSRKSCVVRVFEFLHQLSITLLTSSMNERFMNLWMPPTAARSGAILAHNCITEEAATAVFSPALRYAFSQTLKASFRIRYRQYAAVGILIVRTIYSIFQWYNRLLFNIPYIEVDWHRKNHAR